MDIKDLIFSFYNTSGVKNKKDIDSSRGDMDKRCTVLVEYNDGVKLAIKITNNGFTTPERINGWKELSQEYLESGIYTPQIVSGISGTCFFYTEIDNEKYIVYAEEQKKYKCANEFEPPVRFQDYADDMIQTIGIIANYGTKLVPWHSAYCVYDKFCDEDETDENYECAQNICMLFRKNTKGYDDIIDKIWNTYTELRMSFVDEYRALPCATFQADLNETNILLTKDGKFVGLIDFNTSGTETILNYALCECISSPSRKEELEELMNETSLKKADDELNHYMELVKKHYQFTEAEINAYLKLYHMIVPFRWPTYCLFRWAIKEKKEEYYRAILQWMLYQLTRDDIIL